MYICIICMDVYLCVYIYVCICIYTIIYIYIYSTYCIRKETVDFRCKIHLEIDQSRLEKLLRRHWPMVLSTLGSGEVI